MSKNYPALFSKLHTNKNSTRWTALTTYRAPHKPFLLLAILDLLDTGRIQTNFIQLDSELVESFEVYWEKVMVGERRGNPVLPFFHLQHEGFWHLRSKPGMEQTLAHTHAIDTFQQLHKLVLGAEFDESLFAILQTPIGRTELRQVLIETYFATEVRPALAEVGKITIESFQYSLEMRGKVNDNADMRALREAVGGVGYLADSRSVAFRRDVTNAYAHACAMCGLRLRTPEGYTVVDAAHIVPWSEGRIDHVRNGLALCKVHHWAFDNGLVTVQTNYQIRISPLVLESGDGAGQPLADLAERLIALPSQKELYPIACVLEWHAKEIFRREKPSRLV